MQPYLLPGSVFLSAYPPLYKLLLHSAAVPPACYLLLGLAGLRMEPTQPICPAQLPGTVQLCCTLPAVGAAGVLPRGGSALDQRPAGHDRGYGTGGGAFTRRHTLLER